MQYCYLNNICKLIVKQKLNLINQLLNPDFANILQAMAKLFPDFPCNGMHEYLQIL